MGRKRRPESSRVASQLRALQTFPEKQRERDKAERIKARNELAAARAERQEVRNRERAAAIERAAAKERAAALEGAPVPPTPPKPPATPEEREAARVAAYEKLNKLFDTPLPDDVRAAKRKAQREAAAREAAERDSAEQAEPSAEFEFEPIRYVDGVAQPRRLMMDPRTGEPITKRPAAPSAEPLKPAPALAPVESTDPRPPWVIRGETSARDKAEWLAYQQRRCQPSMGAVLIPAGNGVDVTAGRNGTRTPVDDGAYHGPFGRTCRVAGGRWPS